jgi:glutathione S-transferase
MVKLTVYGDPKSTCTLRILILLEELQLDYKLHHVDLMKNQNKDPRFLELQPFGKIPAVKYGDRVLFESRSILRYIAKNNNDDIDLLGDINNDIWLEVESQNFSPIISKIVYEKVFKPMQNKETNESIISEELHKFKPVLSVYNTRLEQHKFIGGNDFSIADISHIPYLYYFVNASKTFKNFLKDYPYVYKWYKRLMSRKYVQRILESDTDI